ncbi:MAG: transcriptional regulator [Deltaproteobacteria bacterium]|nr:transcriptional regulator [Deltaproteobacteria bacterium]
MEAAKKVEIICDSVEVKNVIEILEKAGVTGYTIIPDVIGKGERGMRRGDDVTGVFNNSMIITACNPALIPQIVDTIRPVLKRIGGVCLISDTQYVIH